MMIPTLLWTSSYGKGRRWESVDIEHMSADELGSTIFLLLHKMSAKEIHINK